MNVPQPAQKESTNDLPKIDLPGAPTATHDRKSLAIALIAATIFLLAAIGIATWLFVQKAGSGNVITKLDPNSTSSIKNVTWVAPTMPSGYAKYDQSTPDSKIVYYANTSQGCSVISRVVANADTSDLAATVAKLDESQGIVTKVTAGEGSTSATIKDSDGQHQYDFAGFEFDQDVNVPTISYKKQSGVVYYKLFGNNLAAVSFVCKLDTYTANTSQLSDLLKTFTVKTER